MFMVDGDIPFGCGSDNAINSSVGGAHIGSGSGLSILRSTPPKSRVSKKLHVRKSPRLAELAEKQSTKQQQKTEFRPTRLNFGNEDGDVPEVITTQANVANNVHDQQETEFWDDDVT